MSDTGVRLDGEQVYDGRIFKVHRDRVRMPNGHEATLEVVRHPGSVVLIPMPEPGRIILVRQYRYAVGDHLWELAAGSLEPGEEPAAGAARECEEETGLVPASVQLVGRFYPTPGYCDELMNFFRLTGLAQRSEGEAARPDEDEDLEVRSFSVEEIRAMVRRGEIQDLKTAVGITLV
ncbi:MAG TPA: NUDIX hydrolase [Vicinamibacterales bacterium]|nr:NUDIX hydrolase [Vicinamibacterales bacterium]